MNLARYGVYGDAAGHYFHPGGELAGYVHRDNSTHTTRALKPDWKLSGRQIGDLTAYNKRLNDYDKALQAANTARGIHTMVGDWDLAYGITDPENPYKPSWLKSYTSTPVVLTGRMGGNKRKRTKKGRKKKTKTLKQLRALSAKYRLNIRKHDGCIKCYKNVVKKYKKCLKKCGKKKTKKSVKRKKTKKSRKKKGKKK